MNIPYTLTELLKVGLTQKQIGAAIGVSQPTISAMTNGQEGVTRPSYKVITGLEQLAKEKGVATDPPTLKRRRSDQVTPP